jgi:hypothetical protein
MSGDFPRFDPFGLLSGALPTLHELLAENARLHQWIAEQKKVITNLEQQLAVSQRQNVLYGEIVSLDTKTIRRLRNARPRIAEVDCALARIAQLSGGLENSEEQ